MEDCHGDTYGAFVANSVVYTVSHVHYCGTLGGWPVYSPWQFRHTLAFTAGATGTLLHNTQSNYVDYFGRPSPTLINWFPDFTPGTYTGQSQATWSVAGNSAYVVEGGEFLTVNNTAQQGLVRFAVRPTAPAKQGARLSGARFVPTLTPTSAGSVRVSFQSNWDRDSKTLTYQVVRNSDTTHPVWTTTADSEWWNRPTLGFTDTGLTPGATYKYRLYAIDPDGNKVAGDTVTITLPAVDAQTAYDTKVIGDGASDYLTLGEPAGATFANEASWNDMDATGTITRGVSGPVTGTTATSFDGSSATAATRIPIAGPNVFTLSAWVNTTSTKGGKIVGFGNTPTGASGNYDRHLYLDNNGRVWFGVYNNKVSTLNSVFPINDGQWHQVVGELGADGMHLYVDGALVGQRSDATFGQSYTGYWRIGGDNLSGWSNVPSSAYLAGSIADVAIFPSELSAQTVSDEFHASGR
jgi:Concanavalin A-like lectin/glucanases superfamily